MPFGNVSNQPPPLPPEDINNPSLNQPSSPTPSSSPVPLTNLTPYRIGPLQRDADGHLTNQFTRMTPAQLAQIAEDDQASQVVLGGYNTRGGFEFRATDEAVRTAPGITGASKFVIYDPATGESSVHTASPITIISKEEFKKLIDKIIGIWIRTMHHEEEEEETPRRLPLPQFLNNTSQEEEVNTQQENNNDVPLPPLVKKFSINVLIRMLQAWLIKLEEIATQMRNTEITQSQIRKDNLRHIIDLDNINGDSKKLSALKSQTKLILGIAPSFLRPPLASSNQTPRRWSAMNNH